jgi:hypothetical protein
MPRCTLCKSPTPIRALYDADLELCWPCHVAVFFRLRPDRGKLAHEQS